MIKSMSMATMALAAGLVVGSVQAAPISIVNPGFESSPNRGAVVTPGWRRTNATTTGIESYASLGTRLDPVPGGGTYLHYSNSAPESIFQVLTATLAANTTYTLKAQAVDRSDLGFQTSSLRLGYVPGTDNGTTGDLIANSFYGEFLLTPTSVVNPTPLNAPVPSTSNGTTNPNDGWQDWTYTFTTGPTPAGLGSPLRIEIVGSGTQSLFDNVSLDAVPEPASLAMLGLVGVTLFGRRRRA